MAINVVEQCRVEPSYGAAAEQLLPLLYSDIIFLPLALSEHLIFYTFQCSESHFSGTVVPNLKNSLSLTLKHFSPFAGKIIFPLTTGMPVSQYLAGDAISFTTAVSDADFSHLTGNLSKDSDQFHDFVARLPPATYSSDFIKFSVAAIQVTLFPNQGFCIGFTLNHAIVDGSTLLRFVKSWASITKFNGDHHLLALGPKFLPFYGRSRVECADSLTTAYWNHMKNRRPTVSSTNSLPTNKTRATFVLSGSQIQKLRNSVSNKKPSMAQVSSFAIVCGHVWTCFARSASVEEAVNDDEPVYFHCVADIRGRLNPPLPDTYFGNCLVLVLAESTHGRLKGDQGIAFAVEAISEAIQKTVDNERGVLDGFVDRLLELEHIKKNGHRMLIIAASPKFDVYAADFGLGEPKKYEVVHNDLSGSVCLCKSREFEDGVEIGLSLTKVKIDAFENVFHQEIREATKVAYDDQLSKL